MSTFYASKDEKVAAAGKAHNAALRRRYPTYDDQLRALNLNVRLALVGDAQVRRGPGPGDTTFICVAQGSRPSLRHTAGYPVGP